MKISASGEFESMSSGPTKSSDVSIGAIDIPRARDIMTWKVTDISINPYNDDWAFNDTWSFNPCINFDGKTWLCSLRTSNYAMPHGVEVKAPRSHPKVTHSRNVMLVLDPKTWKPTHVHKIEEKDGLPRNPRCSSWGFEDIRIFRTKSGGLQGIAASLQLMPNTVKSASTIPVHGTIAEQVLLTFDANYDVVAARPLRFTGFDRRVQKNWPPFNGADEPRFLYSIDDSVVFDLNGPPGGDWKAQQRPPTEVYAAPPPHAAIWQFDGPNLGQNVILAHPAHSPAAHASAGAGRGTGGPGIAVGDYYGLRGGSPLQRVGDNLWLGIGHDGRYVSGIKIYCHTFYAVDDTGLLIARSSPFRLRDDGGGIEFAAGIAVDGDRVVISYGIDDMRCELAETSLAEVLAMLKPTGAVADESRTRVPCAAAAKLQAKPLVTASAGVAAALPVRVEKPWGHEDIWARTDRYVGKILHVRAGESLSLQYHRVKDETVMLVNGEARLQLGEAVSDLKPYVPVHIVTGTKHRLIAVTDCDIHEVSTPELDDVVRIDDRYGRAGNP